MTTKKNKPIDTIRDGSLKATIWQNATESSSFYSVEFSRTYKQDDTYKDSHSFSGTEPLQLARLANKAYDRIAALRATDKTEAAQ